MTRLFAVIGIVVGLLVSLGGAAVAQRWTPSFGQVFVTAKVESGVMIHATLG